MPRRSPRPLAAPRPDRPVVSPTVDGLAGDASRQLGDAPDEPSGEPGDTAGERDDPHGQRGGPSGNRDRTIGLPDDTALLGAYALGALTPEERAAVEERLAASPPLQEELRRLIPVAALLREATVAQPSPPDEPGPRRELRSDGEPAPPLAALDDDARALGPDTSAVAAPVPMSGRVAERPQRDLAPRPERRDDATSSADDVAFLPLEEKPGPLETRADATGHEGGVGGGEAAPAARVEAAPGSLSSRPGGRRARPAPVSTRDVPRPARAMSSLRTWPPSWIAAGLATLIAVGAVLWALALVDRLDTRQTEIGGLEAELSELRGRNDAASVPLAAAEGGPAGADGVAVVVPSEGSLIVRVSGLPASPEGRVYQVWFQGAAEPDGRWIVGPVFRVGESGTTLVELPAAVPDFTRLVISDEPAPGGDAPTGPFLLEGSAAGP